MSTIPSHFQLSFSPLADPKAIVGGENIRFTVLTSRLIRMEYSPTSQFEDRASQLVWSRELTVPAFEVMQKNGRLVIETDHLRLVSDRGGHGFTAETLAVTLKESETIWHYGDEDDGNLLGTTRTLDQVSGATQLEPGLLSCNGWIVVDDSASLVFTEDGWLEPRAGEGVDLYFFGYGHDYQACLKDYGRITGPVPIIPRWALGNWWSRYWEYTQDELINLIREFQAYEVPLSVCIVDMDWHITDVPKPAVEPKGFYPGWTGYTWNRELFPDPDNFIAWLHGQGLKTALNLHPADGVQPHEAMYPAMARRLGIDPASKEPVAFDIANPEFAGAYFELLHHPEETRGVDFWWMDWQQEKTSSLPGLDPLWWLNHLHFYDLARDGDKRPFIFSRWGGLGSHRYPIGFSGDTFVNWESLAFQPYFTATAANVGYGWWSHDIGGHMFGMEEGELYARWVQFGLFSPILRLHSTKNAFQERRPWGYDGEVLRVASEAMRLRHAFIPYLYTMAWLNHSEGQSLVRPMYHDYPDAPAAYECPQQYAFGSELLAAPFVSPAQPELQLARQAVWLPEGDWYDFFTGEYCQGGRKIVVYGRLHDIPVFAKAGAIVPLGPKVGWGGVANPTELHIHLFAGQDGRFTLYEDDGETTAYLKDAFALTKISQQWRGNEMIVTIQPATGETTSIPDQRIMTLYLHGVREPERVELMVDGEGKTAVAAYDAPSETWVVKEIVVPNTAVLNLTLAVDSDSLLSRRDRTAEKCQDMLRAFRMETVTKSGIADYLPKVRVDPGLLAEFTPNLSERQMRALLDVIVSET